MVEGKGGELGTSSLLESFGTNGGYGYMMIDPEEDVRAGNTPC
jgi:hypothetical protein